MLLNEIFNENFPWEINDMAEPPKAPSHDGMDIMKAPKRDRVMGPHQDIITLIEGLIEAIHTLKKYREKISPEHMTQISHLIQEIRKMGFVAN